MAHLPDCHIEKSLARLQKREAVTFQFLELPGLGPMSLHEHREKPEKRTCEEPAQTPGAGRAAWPIARALAGGSSSRRRIGVVPLILTAEREASSLALKSLCTVHDTARYMFLQHRSLLSSSWGTICFFTLCYSLRPIPSIRFVSARV